MKKFSSPLLSKIYILTAVLVTLVIVGVYYILSGNLNGSGEKKAIKVGLILYDEFDPFTNQIASETEKTLSELAYKNNVSINVEVQYSNKSQLRQNDQFAEMIAKDYDVICVNPVDRTDAMQIVDRAKEADIPVIFFNRELVNEDMNRWDKLYYVGADAEQSAIIQANIVIDAFSDESMIDKLDFNHDGVIQYVMLEGEAGHQDAIVRTRVAVERIEAAGFEMEKLGDEIANWNREQAATKMTSILNGHPWQVELVIANDDNMALGAIDALDAFRVQDFPQIVGVNGKRETLEYIDKNIILGTAYNNAPEKGHTIGRMAYYLGLDMDIPKDIYLVDGNKVYIPYERVDKSNVKDYFDKASD